MRNDFCLHVSFIVCPYLLDSSLDGYDRIDVEGINTGTLKSQVSELLRMCRLMRSK